MSSIINATTTAGVTVTGDNSGSLQLATNNGTTALTISTAQVVTLANALPIASGGTGATSAGTALSNLGGLAGSSSQLVKAWLNYNGSTQTINSSFNVSSVTRNSTGYFTVNFTTAMPNANYAQSLATSGSYGAAWPTPSINANNSTLGEVVPTTTDCGFVCSVSLGTYIDPKYINFIAFAS